MTGQLPCGGPRRGAGTASDAAHREIRIGEARFADYGARLAPGRDSLGDHLKAIEGREARRAAMPGLPIYVRVDGKAFPDAVLRQPPSFDARAFDVPGIEDLAACMIWRELDATKNAVSMAARAHFPHKALRGESAAEMQEMLFREKSVNFNGYPAFFKRGVHLRRVVEERILSEGELARIPADRCPAGPVLRSRVVELDLPPLSRVANPVGVLFGGEAPLPRAADRTGNDPEAPAGRPKPSDAAALAWRGDPRCRPRPRPALLPGCAVIPGT